TSTTSRCYVTWKTSLHMCDGRSPTQNELPACYGGNDWSGVPLADFMDCPSNLANNRQVRMLADLSLVGCYNLSSMNDSEHGRILLTFLQRFQFNRQRQHQELRLRWREERRWLRERQRDQAPRSSWLPWWHQQTLQRSWWWSRWR
ncbi:hypothetical protein CRUP_008874, partial [Coryphaenoides rupestris]